jgi:hypothetical protein
MVCGELAQMLPKPLQRVRNGGMIEPSKQREIERLTDLTEAVIGELPLAVVEITQRGTAFHFWLDHSQTANVVSRCRCRLFISAMALSGY